MRLGRARKTVPRRVAFSLETRRLALVAALPTPDGIAIDALEVRDIDSLDQVPALLREIALEHELGACPAVGVLHPDLYEMRMAEAPEVEAHEMAEAVRWSVRDLVDFPTEEATIDYIEIPGNPGRPTSKRIYIVAAKNEVTELVALAAEEAGLHLKKIDIGELTLRNIAARIPEDEHGLGVVRMGQHGGRLTVTRAGQLYLSRRIEMGLSRLLEEPDHADHFGDVRLVEDNAAPESNENFEALLLEIQRSLDFYESQFGQAPIGDLVFAPLEAPVPELLPFLEKHLSAVVRNLDVSTMCDARLPISTADWSRVLLAVGALLETAGETR